jgi:hypothetical protein
MPPAMGLRPPGPPLPTPVGLGFASVLGPTRGGVAKVGNSPLILMFLGAHPPNPLGWGFAPSTPLFPTPVGLGFASVLGPTRGGVANVGNSYLLRFCGGAPPTAPAMGASPPWTPQGFAHPRWLRVRRRFGSHSWRGCKGWLLAPSSYWWRILQAPWTPF